MAKPKLMDLSEINLILEFDSQGVATRTFPSKTPGGEPFQVRKCTGAFPNFEPDENGKAVPVAKTAELDVENGVLDVPKGRRTVLISASSYFSKGIARTSLTIKKVIK